MTNEQVSGWVVNWFRSRGKLRCRSEEALAIDYLQSSLLTSLEIVEFVSNLEDHFGVQFSENEMQDPRFSTIGGIVELVDALRAGDAPQPAREQSPPANIDPAAKLG